MDSTQTIVVSLIATHLALAPIRIKFERCCMKGKVEFFSEGLYVLKKIVRNFLLDSASGAK